MDNCYFCSTPVTPHQHAEIEVPGYRALEGVCFAAHIECLKDAKAAFIREVNRQAKGAAS